MYASHSLNARNDAFQSSIINTRPFIATLGHSLHIIVRSSYVKRWVKSLPKSAECASVEKWARTTLNPACVVFNRAFLTVWYDG